MISSPRKVARTMSAGALAAVSTLLISGSMLGSTDAVDDNAGYELTGCIEQWETTIMLGGGLELTGHIEPMWEGIEHADDQTCDDGAIPASPMLSDWRTELDQSLRQSATSADVIIELVRMWGVCPTVSCGPDLTGDGLVETADLMQLLLDDEPQTTAESGDH